MVQTGTSDVVARYNWFSYIILNVSNVRENVWNIKRHCLPYVLTRFYVFRNTFYKCFRTFCACDFYYENSFRHDSRQCIVMDISRIARAVEKKILIILNTQFSRNVSVQYMWLVNDTQMNYGIDSIL